MQNKQKRAIAKRLDRNSNIAPRQKPPMVTRVDVEVNEKRGTGIIVHPPQYAR